MEMKKDFGHYFNKVENGCAEGKTEQEFSEAYSENEQRERAAEIGRQERLIQKSDGEEHFEHYSDEELIGRIEELVAETTNYYKKAEENDDSYTTAEMEDRSNEIKHLGSSYFDKGKEHGDMTEDNIELYKPDEMQDRVENLKDDMNSLNELAERTCKAVSGEQVGVLPAEDVYEYAKLFLTTTDVRYIDDPDYTDSMYFFNGRNWEILSEIRLHTLIYDLFTEADRHKFGKIENVCKNIADFIRFEKRLDYLNGEIFSEEDFRRIQNRVVFRNCVYDAETGETFDFDAELPYTISFDADYIDDDVETPNYDKLIRDAMGGDGDSMFMVAAMIGYLVVPNRSAKCFL